MQRLKGGYDRIAQRQHIGDATCQIDDQIGLTDGIRPIGHPSGRTCHVRKRNTQGNAPAVGRLHSLDCVEILRRSKVAVDRRDEVKVRGLRPDIVETVMLERAGQISGIDINSGGAPTGLNPRGKIGRRSSPRKLGAKRHNKRSNPCSSLCAQVRKPGPFPLLPAQNRRVGHHLSAAPATRLNCRSIRPEVGHLPAEECLKNEDAPGLGRGRWIVA